MNFKGPIESDHATETDREAEREASPDKKRRGGSIAGLGLALVTMAALASGAWSHYAQQRQIDANATQERDFIPQVRVAAVQPSDTSSY